MSEERARRTSFVSAPSAPWSVGVAAALAGLVALGGIAILASAIFTAVVILPAPPTESRDATMQEGASAANTPAFLLTDAGSAGTSE